MLSSTYTVRLSPHHGNFLGPINNNGISYIPIDSWSGPFPQMILGRFSQIWPATTDSYMLTPFAPHDAWVFLYNPSMLRSPELRRSYYNLDKSSQIARGPSRWCPPQKWSDWLWRYPNSWGTVLVNHKISLRTSYSIPIKSCARNLAEFESSRLLFVRRTLMKLIRDTDHP